MSRRVFARGVDWCGVGGGKTFFYLVCQCHLHRVLHFTLLLGESWPSCLLVFREKLCLWFYFIFNLCLLLYLSLLLYFTSALAVRERISYLDSSC